VPKSKVRKKAVYTPPQRSQKVAVSPRWLVPTMVGCWLLGLAWIAVYYVTASTSDPLALTVSHTVIHMLWRTLWTEREDASGGEAHGECAPGPPPLRE
jgi:hypothetical protein